jgi:hypothetical protein
VILCLPRIATIAIQARTSIGSLDTLQAMALGSLRLTTTRLYKVAGHKPGAIIRMECARLEAGSDQDLLCREAREMVLFLGSDKDLGEILKA